MKKETFVKIMETVMTCTDLEGKFFGQMQCTPDDDNPICEITNNLWNMVCDLAKEFVTDKPDGLIGSDDDEEAQIADAISYFMSDCNFLRDPFYNERSVTTTDGKPVGPRTFGQLYDYLKGNYYKYAQIQDDENDKEDFD